MRLPHAISGLGAVAGRYDALLCDAWGVIHDGRRVFDGVEAALTRFRRERGPVVVLTNAPKPSSLIPSQLDRIGLSREAYDAVVTSGDATRAEIARRIAGRCATIGWDSDDALYDGLRLNPAPIADADYIVCTGVPEAFLDDPERLAPSLEAPALRAAPMICANPDMVVRWRGELVWCAGKIAEIYARLGGPVTYCGKPHPTVYELALGFLRGLGPSDLPAARVLAVGDGAATDMLGANNAGCGSLFIVGEQGIVDGAGDEAVAESLARAGATADYHMTGLRW